MLEDIQSPPNRELAVERLNVSKEGKQLRRLSGLVVSLALVTTGCGGGDGDGGDLGEDVFGGIGQDSGDVDPADQGSSGGGTLENPTPEATSPLPADSIRIGDTAWERKIPTDGQCFVHEDDGTIPDTGNVWGSVNNDPEVEVRVKHNEDGSQSAQVDSNLIGWISGQMNGTELTVNLDFETSSISGKGLFYNTHADEWAYGSFAFTCLEGE